MTSDDAFMMLAGVRYCLGRHSYAPSLCCDWLKARWPQIAAADRTQIIREIGEHVAGVDAGRWHDEAAGWEVDVRTWRNFHAWARLQNEAEQEHRALANAARTGRAALSARTEQEGAGDEG